ncbi:MAG: FAD:protein FMN transferase [Thermoguttaceae bacterium]
MIQHRFAVFLLILFIGPTMLYGLERFVFEQMQMGVPVKIILYTDSAEKAESVAQKAFNRFEQLNAIMSDYDNESEIVRLARNNDQRFVLFPPSLTDTEPATDKEQCVNREEGQAQPDEDGWFPISNDLFFVLEQARHFGQISKGAFDVTISPLVQIWRRAKRQRKWPRSEEIETARNSLGLPLWELRESDHSIRFAQKGMRLDLGGIAKGYAIDQAFELIQQEGINVVLVDAGGDMRLGDPPMNGWTVTIGPLEHDGTPRWSMNLDNRAIASSGDTFQYFELDGKRYSHIIDPRTGFPLVNQALVTVFATTAIEADALASAISVLGPEQGLQLVESLPGISAHIVVQETVLTDSSLEEQGSKSP